MPQARWQCLNFSGTGQFNPFLVSDLDRPFRHPVIMVIPSVTPMHHLTIVVSSAARGQRRYRA
jgi:hypothetical protein